MKFTIKQLKQLDQWVREDPLLFELNKKFNVSRESDWRYITRLVILNLIMILEANKRSTRGTKNNVLRELIEKEPTSEENPK